MSNLKSKVDKLAVNKLAPFPVDLSKLRGIIKTDVAKKDAYNAKLKNIEDKIPDITNVGNKTTLNAKRNEVKGEVPNITKLATTGSLTGVENKTPSASNLVKKLTITETLMKLKRKLMIIIMISILLLKNLIN